MRLGHSNATIPEIDGRENFDTVVHNLAVYVPAPAAEDIYIVRPDG